MVLGVVGSIGSGKSLFSAILKEFDFFNIEMDEVARSLDYNGSPYNAAIKKWFGHKYLKPDGTLDRKELRQLVFENPKGLDRLNQIVQPLIREQVEILVRTQRQKGNLRVSIIGPILYQIQLDHVCDAIVQVYSSPETLVERIQKRDNTSSHSAKNILEAQEKLFMERTGKPPLLLENNHKDIEAFKTNARQFLEELLKNYPN